METTLQSCLPLIRFLDCVLKTSFKKVHPYQKLLKPQLHEELLKSYLDSDNNIPSNNTLLPRIRNVDSAIVKLNTVSVISRWIDKSNIKTSMFMQKGLYLPYEFK